MTTYQQIEVCLPINSGTTGKLSLFLTAVSNLLGPDYFHSRQHDPWSRIVARMARRLQMAPPYHPDSSRLSFVGYYTPKSGRRQEEAMILLRIAVDPQNSSDYVRNLRRLHKIILGLGEEASWIVYHPVTRVSD